METVVVIPSDLKMKSLDSLKSILQFQTEDRIHVILLHGVYLSNSISDLLFFDRTELKLHLAEKKFLLELLKLEQEMKPRLVDIQIEFFSGFTQSSFNAFMSTLGVDKIIIPQHFEFDWSNKKSMNILPFLLNSKLDKHLISSDVFYNEESEQGFKNAWA